MKRFTDQLRYEYPLIPGSLVIDLGAYHGNWSYEIARRYHCRILAYEPIQQFYDIARKRLADCKTVTLYNAGVAPRAGVADFGIKGDMTGQWTDSPTHERVTLFALLDILPAAQIDLIKLNIEGGEYDLLEYILDHNLATRFINIQVQFHSRADCLARWPTIFNRMQETHDVTYLAPFCWENYELRQ